MGQIIINYMCVFVVPLLIGIAVRFLFRGIKRAYLITAVFIALAAVCWGVNYAIPANGSEFYAIIALISTSAAAGALLTGLLTRLKKNR